MEPQSQSLVCPSHTKQYIGVIILGALIGGGISFVCFNYFPQGIGSKAYQKGFDAAKKRINESSFGVVLSAPDDIRSVSGTVIAVSGNRIILNTAQQNPLEDPTLDDRTVVITSDTRISRTGQKDLKIMQVEMEEFMKKNSEIKPGMPQAIPPESLTLTVVTIADITVGQFISAVARENIKTAKEFTATEIQIQSELIIR